MDDHRTGFSKHDDEIEHWRSRVPPGVPGAGWFVSILFLFSVFIFTGWAEGWWENNHNTAAPAASHRTNGAGNRVSQ
jgi:hypothetical protein